MKRLFLFFILITFSFSVSSQISFIGNESKRETPNYVSQYDSLTNIYAATYENKKSDDEADFFGHLIGQTLIFVGSASPTGRDENFKIEYQEGVGWLDRPYTLEKTADAPNIGTEFIVEDVSPKKSRTFHGQKLILRELSTNKKYLYCPDWDNSNAEWIVKGFYEKTKQLYIGKEYYYIDAKGFVSANYPMFDLETNEKAVNIENYSKWKCVDVSVKSPQKGDDESDNRLVLVYENEQGRKCYCYYFDFKQKPVTMNNSRDVKFYRTGKNMRHIDIFSKEFQENANYHILYAEITDKDIFLGKFLNKEQVEKINIGLKDIELKRQRNAAAIAKAKNDAKEKANERKNNLIKKYGESTTNDILNGIVKLGWSKDMCREAWGNPKDINKTIGSYGVHEQWVYGGDNYLYFENGILTTIQN